MRRPKQAGRGEAGEEAGYRILAERGGTRLGGGQGGGEEDGEARGEAVESRSSSLSPSLSSDWEWWWCVVIVIRGGARRRERQCSSERAAGGGAHEIQWRGGKAASVVQIGIDGVQGGDVGPGWGQEWDKKRLEIAGCGKHGPGRSPLHRRG